MKEILRSPTIILSLFVLLILAALIVSTPATTPAATTWSPGVFPFTSVSAEFADTTVATELLPAPGAGWDWWVQSVTCNVTDADAGQTITIQDDAGTPVNIAVFSVNALSNFIPIDFDRGIQCSQNSGVMLEFSGSSTAVWLNITAHKERH